MQYWIKKLGKVPDEKETQWISLKNPVGIPKPVLIFTIGIRVGPYSVEVQNGFNQDTLAQVP